MRLLKCYGTCNEKYVKTDLTNYKSKNYCRKCYEQKYKDDQERALMTNVICTYFDIPYPTGHMLKQMKTFREERNYSYKDQANAICYSKDILKKNMKPSYGLGLIPYVIDGARDYYTKQEKQLNDMEGKDVIHEIKKVTKLEKITDKDLPRQRKLLNMEDILK